MLRRALERGRSLVPMQGFSFGRPIVVLQSDDWGRAGIRDQEGWEQLRTVLPDLGARPYDFYSLETAGDIAALTSLLHRHRDSNGTAPCLEMNFIVANLDFARTAAVDVRDVVRGVGVDGVVPVTAEIGHPANSPAVRHRDRHLTAAGRDHAAEGRG